VKGSRKRWIAIARGDEPADLVLKGGHVLSVFTNEFLSRDVAIAEGHIVGIGDYAGPHEIDVSGRYVVPGFIDGHCHIESSKLNVDEFARAVLRSGTTTVVVDPHEMANVLGIPGVDYVLQASEGLPLGVYVMMPSCVPASQFESPNHELRAQDFSAPLVHPRVLGIAEMMNYPAVISGDSSTLEKLAMTNWQHIDGHAPGVTGADLNAYVVAGPSTDHECVTFEEALEKRRLGMWVMIREASMIRNLVDLLPLVTQYGTDNTLFVTDDREVDTLLHEGHINAMVRLAVNNGLSPADAVKLATLNVARCHRIEGLGAVAPGYLADICVLSDLEDFVPDLVFKAGKPVVESGTVVNFAAMPIPDFVRETVHIPKLSPQDLEVSAGDHGSVEIRVVDLIPDQVTTRAGLATARIVDGRIVADPERDLAKLVVVERHHASGQAGIGFVRGFNLKRGAFASTVAHDAHNIVVAGVNDDDIIAAVNALADLGGGLCVVDGREVIASLPLPIAGLMSDRPAEEVDQTIRRLEAALADLGVTIPTPFMYLSFLALSVIPEIRVTDKGIVDVNAFELVPLIIG
jgi:adenine deaminase